MSARRRVLFGPHPTQAPAIERLVDHARFDVAFAPLEESDFAAFDLVVPLTIDQIDPARAAGGRAVLPTPELVELCDDKLLFNERLVALGFGDLVPELLPPGTDVYPHIVKARRGDFGDGCRMVRGPGGEADAPDAFRQRAVEGADEFVLHLLRVRGRIRYTLCYRYDMGDPLAVRGREATPRLIEPADPAPALARCEAILGALGFEGTCCFNYKLEGGRPMILELNPRFGGSLVGDVTAYLAAHLDAL